MLEADRLGFLNDNNGGKPTAIITEGDDFDHASPYAYPGELSSA